MCCTNIRVNECVCVYVKEKKKEKGIANVSNFERLVLFLSLWMKRSFPKSCINRAQSFCSPLSQSTGRIDVGRG